MHTSAHPFSSSLSIGDCRITTAFKEDDFTSNIFSIIHEVGHATYNHQVDQKYEGRHIVNMISMGMHESQSRLLENCIGRSKAFWDYNYPLWQEEIAYLKDVKQEEFLAYINQVNPSLIRIEADELTYSIHILIRYIIEKGMFDGSIDLDDLPQIWNKLYKEYLGVDVIDDCHGILQDVHWSYSSFGYFPTYALGSAIACQIMSKMNQDLDVEQLLKDNKLANIQAWLKENVHQYGGLYSYNEILKRITDEEFNARYYIDYLKDKYSKLYQC